MFYLLVVIITSVLLFVSSLTGASISSARYKSMNVVLGLAIIAYLTSFFHSLGFNPWLFLPFILVLIAYRWRVIDWKSVSYSFSVSITAYILLLLPMLVTNGSMLVIPGSMVTDNVVHAALARTCDENRYFNPLIFPSDIFTCVAGYPTGSHAMIAILVSISGYSPPLLTYFTAMLLLASTATIWVWLFGELSTKHSPLMLPIALVIPLSTLQFTSLQLGFFAQIASMPFVLGTLVFLFSFFHTTTKSKFKNNDIFLTGILMSVSFLTYTFVSAVPLSIAFLMLLISSIRNKLMLISLSFTIFTCLLLTIIHPVGIVQSLSLISQQSQSVIANASKDVGHLITFIHPLILGGFWFESDYRTLTPGITTYLEFILSGLIVVFSFITLIHLIKKRNHYSLLYLSLCFSIFIVFLITSSPYSTLKMMFYLSPIVIIFAWTAILKMTSTSFHAILVSTFVIIFSFLAQHTSDSLRSMPYQQLQSLESASKITGNQKILIYTANPWARYYFPSNSSIIKRVEDGSVPILLTNQIDTKYVLGDKGDINFLGEDYMLEYDSDWFELYNLNDTDS